jgi:hypothetical protein
MSAMNCYYNDFGLMSVRTTLFKVVYCKCCLKVKVKVSSAVVKLYKRILCKMYNESTTYH